MYIYIIICCSQPKGETVHGEELAYVFGAPLVGGFSHFTLNYTFDEVFLSELVMTQWTNFAKTGYSVVIISLFLSPSCIAKERFDYNFFRDIIRRDLIKIICLHIL